MKRRNAIFALLLVALIPARSVHAQLTRGNLSVAGFETEGSVGMTRAEYDALGRALTELLFLEMADRTEANMIRVRQLVSKRPGRVDLAGMRLNAAPAGVKVLVVGTLVDQYGDIHLEARLVDVGTGNPVAVVRGDSHLAKREQLPEAVADLASRIGVQPGVGGSKTAPSRSAIPIDALLNFGRGLNHEDSGEGTQAAEAYRAALKSAPGFREVTDALKRVGSL